MTDDEATHGPSLLATAALLGARRRWHAAHEAGESAGDVGDQAAPQVALPRPAMPPVHLEDPEWTRAVLGLVADAPPTRIPVNALVLVADKVELYFPGEVRGAETPFADGPAGSWVLDRRSHGLAGMPGTPTIVTASRRAALVTVWSGPTSRCLVDLVACGSVAIDGPPVAVGATLSDVVVELATHRWCDLDELVVVGFGSEIAGLERAVCLSNAEAALEYLAEQRTSEVLSQPRARCLVVAPPIGRRSPANLNPLRTLVELVHATPDTGLVCCDPSLPNVRGLWRLAAHREPIDIAIRRRNLVQLRLAPGLPAEVAVLPPARPKVGADGTEDEEPLPRSYEELDHPLHGARTGRALQALPVQDPGSEGLDVPSVLVRVLGPVDVVHSGASLDRRPRVTELLAYLALHPGGATGEAIASAVWPERRVRPQTLANRLTEARQALGTTASGLPRLRRVAGRHVLSDVSTDWAHFVRLTEPGTTAAEWTEALKLVRGRPFDGFLDAGWVVFEGLGSTVESRIVDAASRLAAHSLDDGHASHAEWSVRRGLLAAPWDERLYRMLMVVSHVAGNRAGIDAALHTLARALDWDGDPLDGVHRETALLYRQLVGRHDASDHSA
jgi:DNA-binding SARP family transcriptional activator